MTIISRQVNTAQKPNKAAGYSQSYDDDEEEEGEEEEVSHFYCLGKRVCLPSAGVQVVPQHGAAAVPLRRKGEKAEKKKQHPSVSQADIQRSGARWQGWESASVVWPELPSLPFTPI